MITNRIHKAWLAIPVVVMCLMAAVLTHNSVYALTPIPPPAPQPGSYGIEATKPKAPPTRGATITTPGNGASFSSSPITVSGICPNELLVQIFNNGVMVGSVVCTRGSFTLQVSLFSGANELSALVYDEVDQTGPPSNTVSVNYTNTNFTAFGQGITLTSPYGRRSAGAGAQLSWPLQLSGGTGPYAFSIDWGDGTAAELKSQSFAGVVPLSHIYKRAGIYRVNVKVTDTNGVTAFLQLVAVANGKVDTAAGSKAGTDGSQGAAVERIIWAPAALSLAMLPVTYWLGRRSQLVSIRNKMLKDAETYGS